MMIITGIFLFLLGTKLGYASTKTEVKYEGPSKITVTEEKDDNVILPGLGSPPFAPSFFHQGSNFFFNPQIVMPERIPTGIERVATAFQQQKDCDITIAAPEVTSDLIIEKEPFVEAIKVPVQPLATPQLQLQESIQIIPKPIESGFQVFPPLAYEVPIPNPKIEVLQEPSNIAADGPEPCVDFAINNAIPYSGASYIPVETPNGPMLVEEGHTSGGYVISEMEVQINEIPPPPELPPLVMSEIPKPVYVGDVNKRVVLIPSVPELQSFLPPPVMVAEAAKESIIPTVCAQDIVFDRVLPRLALEKGKLVEYISIPASKRAPVVSSIIY